MFDYAWRDVEGVDPEKNDSGALPDLPLPHDAPIYTNFDGPWGTPWLDGFESPDAARGELTPSPNPTYPEEDVGRLMPPGDYEGAYRTLGPVQQWGHEASGGWNGDQAIGRIMRFPANIPDRYDANGVSVGDYRDLLAGSLAANQVDMFSDTNNIDDLVSWTGTNGFEGWGT